MSEERIKERCKREDIALKIVKGFLEKDCYTDTELEYSLNTLLELYKKQKEEIEQLKNTEEYAKLGKETLLDAIHKQQKEIEELKKLKYIMNFETGSVTKIDNDFISKDKIRHILLKFQNEYGEDLETTGRLFIGKEVIQYGEDMLDEIAKELDIKLLEE